mmetsp:Transcript_67291/g.106913  ORF Transcript_67291/g.106913 Transcript_67291/m.106913 type:complete len:188 (-) Transcript_67291:78-641(-)
MGGFFARALELIQGRQEKRILMIGLDAAGKTTILYKLKIGDIVHTIPTIGFNVETVEYKNIKFECWDVGGQERIRPLWRHYYHGTDGIIFVVDSHDRARIDDSHGYEENAKYELGQIINEPELKDAALLILANKQDLPNAMRVNEVTQKLGLAQCKNRHWYCQATCATTGDGLYEGLDWLSRTLTRK